jgi:hypothetical protein
VRDAALQAARFQSLDGINKKPLKPKADGQSHPLNASASGFVLNMIRSSRHGGWRP